MKREIHASGSSVTFSLERPVVGLENGIGKFFLGLGPGPEGPEKPIPLLLQVLDPRTFDLGFNPGDTCYQILSNDQNRFALPKALPPILTLLEPGDYDNPDGSLVLARYAYSDGAFLLLHDLLQTGFRFTLKEFLKLSRSLGEVLAFLHSQGTVHGQWNPRSILCIPDASSGSPFDDVRSYRYHLLNTGVRYRDPLAIPKEFLERGYFPREILSPSNQLPDYEAYDLEADVYCLAACLKDIFQRASCFEELTTQAVKIRDHFHRVAIRRGQEPSPDRIRHKEQEILDHLYTFKVKTEEMVQSGLRARGERSNAAHLWEHSRELYRKIIEYGDKLLEVGFGPINIFGEDLRRYVPYQIKLEPRFVNSFDDTIVTLSGADLPYEVVRLTLGETNRPLEVVEGTPTRIRFRVPRGFAPGTHQILINNQRTSEALKVIAPTWKHLIPDKVRKPWPGFGNIVVRVAGHNLPSSPFFSLAPEKGGAEKGGSGPAELEAVLVHPETAQEERTEGFADERVSAEDEVYLIQFSPDAPVGVHPLRCKGLETGLRLSIGEVLPDPVLERDGIAPAEVLNHREQLIHLRGRNFHETMVADLGEAAPDKVPLHFQGERSAVITLPAGFPPGEYPVRINRHESGLRLLVREPRWTSLEPQRVTFGGRRDTHRDLLVSGQYLPPLDESSGETYRLTTQRGREIPQGVLKWEEVEPQAIHRVRISAEVHRGSPRLFFDGRDTGLQIRVHRKLSPAVRMAAKLAALASLVLAAFLVVEGSRPRIDAVDTPRVFNFGESLVLVAGERVRGVTLEDERGREVKQLAVRMLAAQEPAKRNVYSFSSAGIPAGSYRLVPSRGLLRGKPATSKLEVLSPGFELSPRLVNRLVPADLTLTSATRFPLKDAKKLSLRAAAQPAAGGKREKEGGETGPAAPQPPRGPGESGRSEAKEPAKSREAPGAPEAPREFALGPEGRIQLKSGTFAGAEEGEYEVLLDGFPLSGHFTRDLKPLTVRVVGPRISSVAPNPVTLSEGGNIRIALLGENLPASMPVGLVKKGTREEIAFRLKPLADGFEGPAEAGTFLSAWDLERGKLELIPGISLEVFPPPEIVEVLPPVVEPQQEVELTLKGVNLKEARFISMKPLARTGEAIRFAMDPGRLRQEVAAQSEYQTEPLTFETGTYAILPGEKAFLEVVEDCRKLLDAYRKDLSERDRLLNCLRDRHAREEVRRMAADVFFDQGLYDEALGLYRNLGDLKSRFRVAFLSRYLGEEAAAREAPVRFTARAEDPKSDPYYRGATALGWIAGEEGQPPADPGSTWDLDFVRGSLAEDPRAAVEALGLSIEKKKTSAVLREIQPFAPAHQALAAARLRLAISGLGAGDPVVVRQELRKTFFDVGENYQLLLPPDRARSCFFYGHTTLWTSLDEERAAQVFNQGIRDGENTEYAGLCGLYLEALGASGAREPHQATSAGSTWEAAFIIAFKHYRRVRNTPNYNILTEKYDFGTPLYPEERKESLDLHQAIKRLESTPEAVDPFAHHALLFALRNAQLVSWPRQDGGLKAREHREKLLSLKLEGEAALLRDFYILEGEVGPLESAQVALLDWKETLGSLRRVGDLLKGGFQEPVHARLKLLEKKLQRS